MRRFLPTFLLIILVLAFYPFVFKDDSKQTLKGLPWQVELLADGSSQVFGLTLDKSTLGDAVDILGTDMELAVIAAGDEAGNLEMYYAHYRAGLLGGKLILATSRDDASTMAYRINAVKTEILKTGSRKYVLTQEDYEKAFQSIITNIAFIPAVNLDHDTIIKRFGQPGAIVHQDELVHYLYPEKGLAIALSEEGKEVLQYVSPKLFSRLQEPLQN
jgi:hypothetical protein